MAKLLLLTKASSDKQREKASANIYRQEKLEKVMRSYSAKLLMEDLGTTVVVASVAPHTPIVTYHVSFGTN